MHSGSREPGAPVEPWGSGNHCAMFRQGYLEVIGLTDETLFSYVKDMVSRYEGPHTVAIGCREDADLVYRTMHARGIPVDPPRALERDAAFGPNDESTRRARFRNAIIPRALYPEARFQYIEHVTREVLWQPHLLQQPNGVEALAGLWFASPDPAVTAARLAPLVAADPIQEADGGFRIPLAKGSIRVLGQRAWLAMVRGVTTPPLPAPVALAFRVRSVESTRELLASAGVQFSFLGGSVLAVGPQDACGAALLFSDRQEDL